MQTTNSAQATCVLQLPSSLSINAERLQVWKGFNTSLELKTSSINCLEIFDNQELGRIPFYIPELNEEIFLELCELNPELSLEYDGNMEIEIKMGVFRLIARLTVKIIASLGIWASENKKGEVYGENGEYEIEVSGKRIRRIPDVSYISYQTASEEIQNSWNYSFIPIPPNMAMEIVSAKKGLKNDLKKMKEVWMPLGVDVGIVVCPFTEKIYIFEKGRLEYTTQSIYEDFSHPLLEGYSDNFGKYLK